MKTILDDGRVTDSKGNVVNFKNTIIVFTSNVGSQKILEVAGDVDRQEEMRRTVMSAMRERFKPEFINRIDEFVIFNSLGPEQLRKIVKLELNRLQGRLDDRRITLEIGEDALDYIADIGYDAIYGARPLKRTIQREIETPLSKKLIAGDAEEGDIVKIGVVNDRISIAIEKEKAPLF